MKKKIILVNYVFTTGSERYEQSVLVSLKYEYEGQYTVEQEENAAIEAVIQWFKTRYPESELLSVVPNHTISATMNSIRQTVENDGYSAEMTIDRIDQLIAEMKPYNDRLVLNGWAPMDTITYFKGRPGRPRYYVNTFEDPDSKDKYTVIKW